MLNTNQKIEHLRKLGFNGDFEQIERMYNGEKFDVRDEEYRRLLQLSKEYCMRFTQLSELISRAKSAEEIENYNKEKSENIDSIAYCILYLFHDSILIQKTAKYTLL